MVAGRTSATSSEIARALTMSSSTSSAFGLTSEREPDERSSITVTAWPSAMSLSTTWDPMNPAPPVTIALGAIRPNLYRRRRGGAGEYVFDGRHRLVDALEHAHAL